MNQHQHIIDDLLVKYLLGEASPEEIQSVQDWLSSDPANQHYYRQVRLIWEKSLQLRTPQDPPLRNINDLEGDENKAWTQLRQRIHTPKTTSFPRWTRLAASLLLPLLLAGLTWWWSSRSNPVQIARTGEHTLTDTLPDGSIVFLNKHTQLSHNGNRTVDLQGEAFFNVAPNKTKPFIVHAGKTTITVLGTTFNVHMNADTTTILVESGQIKVSAGNQDVILSAGEQLQLTPNDTSLTKQPASTRIYRYYRPRELDCIDTPLEDLVQALNTAYDARIEIGNPALQQLKITTTFKNESLDQILSVLEATFGLKEKRTDSRIILY